MSGPDRPADSRAGQGFQAPSQRYFHWPFGRGILAAFAALAALAVAVTVVSFFSLRSVVASKDAVVAEGVRDVMDTDAMNEAHQRRISELRAYLLSHERSHRQEMVAARAEVVRLLDSLFARAKPDSEARGVLAKLRPLEAEYHALVEQAVRDPGKANSMLEFQARPRRQELERVMAQVMAINRGALDRAKGESARAARSAMQFAIFFGLANALLLAWLGWLVHRLLQKEQAAMAQSRNAQDILQRARQRSALLAEVGKILSETPDARAALTQVASRTAEWLADVFLIELAEAQGLRPVALVTAKTPREALLRSLHSELPRGLGSIFGTDAILVSQRPVLHEKIEDQRLVALGVQSYIVVPLRVRGRTPGVLLLVRTEGHEGYGPSDLSFAQELGHQMALALDNARLLQEAELGLRMREDLLATVAHDLKNPLASIRMNAELALKQAPEDARQQRSFSAIRESAQAMDRLIHDLLELTKIESGRIVLERGPQDAADLIEACVKIVSGAAADKSIEVLRDVRPGECIAECDRDRVLQVLANLVGNAIKFTAKGGRVRIDAQATGEGIRFSVIDNGPGIAGDQLPHVFERYWQASRTQARGTGLGLSIARGIVEAHGGRIWAESALNIGSRFFFTIPEARKKTGPTPRAA